MNMEEQILHRDLSLRNLQCYETANGWVAALIDYDMSSLLEDHARGREATSKHRTGTGPYMARELLDNALKGVVVEHVYAHELESWLYILLQILLRYPKHTAGDPLKLWQSTSQQVILEKKILIFSGQSGDHMTFSDKVRVLLIHTCHL